jgi:hypothetical protein
MRSIDEDARAKARAAALDAVAVVALAARGASRKTIRDVTGRPRNWIIKVERLYGLSDDQVYSADQLLV